MDSIRDKLKSVVNCMPMITLSIKLKTLLDVAKSCEELNSVNFHTHIYNTHMYIWREIETQRQRHRETEFKWSHTVIGS